MEPYTHEQIVSENIQIAPFEIIQLFDFSIKHKKNEHSYLTCKAVVSEDNYPQYLEWTDTKSEITVNKRLEDGQTLTIYKGYLQNLQITNVNQVYYMSISAVSGTITLDLEKVFRSYQNSEADYRNLIAETIDKYPKARFIDNISQKRKINGLRIQYQETCWEFVKRLASELGGNIFSTDQQIEPHFYFGFPNAVVKGEIEAYNYECNRDYLNYRILDENTEYKLMQGNCVTYRVKSLQIHFPGDKVSFKNRIWYITDVERILEQGILYHYYTLATTDAAIAYPIKNEKIKGVSLKGTVQSVKEDRLLVSLDIDRSYQTQPVYWFTYSTSYTSDNNIGWYMMPEPGDRVRIYFPTEEEVNGYALGAIREDQGKEEYLDPNVKTLKNKHGKTITLERDKITIFGNGTQIILSDEEGLIMKSDSTVSISGSNNVQIHGNEILMDASDRIKLSVNNNSITVDQRIILNGTDVKMN